MKRIHRTNVKAEIIREPGAKETIHRKLIDTPNGADRFVLTEFDISPNESTPPHHHDWEHEIYVLEGGVDLVLPGEGRAERVQP